jgi:hypothetical protein
VEVAAVELEHDLLIDRGDRAAVQLLHALRRQLREAELDERRRRARRRKPVLHLPDLDLELRDLADRRELRVRVDVIEHELAHRITEAVGARRLRRFSLGAGAAGC